MASIAPPSLSQEPGTPAHEWAQQTVGAVDGAAETTRQNTVDNTSSAQGATGTDGNRSNVTTPGFELPGAFPKTASTTGAPITTTISETAQSALTSAQEAAANAQQQVAPVVQSATQSAAGVFASAGQAARQYLPASVVGTLEGAGVLAGPGIQTTNTGAEITSLPLPSKETTFSPSYGGVGSLPGTVSEADVAKLPEERELESQIGGPVGREGIVASDAAGLVGSDGTVIEGTGSGGEQSVAGRGDRKDAPPDIWPTPGLTSEVPDLRQPVTSPHTGTTHRPLGTMTSPDSDAQAAAAAVRDSTTARHGHNTADSTASRQDRDKPLPAPGNTSTVDSPDNTPNTDYARDPSKSEITRAEPSQTHASPTSTTDARRTRDEAHGENEPTKYDTDNVSAATGASSESGGKPSLKQKIKGEVKVLAGKISKDPKKVEAGKALKEGHTV